MSGALIKKKKENGKLKNEIGLLLNWIAGFVARRNSFKQAAVLHHKQIPDLFF